MSRVSAAVFDAYGTLFDVHTAASKMREAIGPDADRLSQVWRQKQLEYTWLRTLMQRHADFWQVTCDALDYALDVVGISDASLRDRLLASYRTLDTYPEVATALSALREGQIRTGILSNGSPSMLADAVANAGIGPHLDAVLSVEAVGLFKPAPAVYEMATDRFQLEPNQIAFMTSNAWDAAGAASFGLHVVWINRFDQPPERLSAMPSDELKDLAALPELLLSDVG